MEQHCDWIVHGTVGLRGKGCTRMRHTLHLSVLGHAFRASGDMACSSFERLRCDTSIYLRAARYKPVDSSEAAEAALTVTLIVSLHGRSYHDGLRLRPSNMLVPDLT